MDSKKFKMIRLKKAMSQREFAAFLGVSESTVAAIETGRRTISDQVRACLARKVEIDADLICFFDSFRKYT